MKSLESFFHDIEKLFGHTRGAGTDSFLFASCRIERNRTDAVKEQFAHQFAGGHARVTDRKEETVTDRFGYIAVVDDIESIFSKKPLHTVGPAAILFGLFDEVDFAVAAGV